MKKHIAAKGRRIEEEDEEIEVDEEEGEESGPVEYSDAQKLMDEIVTCSPKPEDLKTLIAKCYAEAGRAWEDREHINTALRKARAHLAGSEARWMAEERVDERAELCCNSARWRGKPERSAGISRT